MIRKGLSEEEKGALLGILGYWDLIRPQVRKPHIFLPKGQVYCLFNGWPDFLRTDIVTVRKGRAATGDRSHTVI